MNTLSDDYGGKGYKIWNCENGENNKDCLDNQPYAKDDDYLNPNNHEHKKSNKYSIANRYLLLVDNDYLYHLGLVNKGDNLAKQFGDVRFVLMGGTAQRMKNIALLIQKELNINEQLDNLTKNGHRYTMYKIGPVICVNHGIGHPSLTTLLHEIFKLLIYAKCRDVTILRLGTCGAISKEPGTVIVTNRAVDEKLTPYFTQVKLGQTSYIRAKPDKEFLSKLKKITDKITDYQIEYGTTLTANDFYEGQGRLDGMFCDYSAEDAKKFKEKLKEAGVSNIEMEAVPFMAFCSQTDFDYGIINVALVDRLKEDQVKLDSETLTKFEKRPAMLAIEYIKQQLKQN